MEEADRETHPVSKRSNTSTHPSVSSLDTLLPFLNDGYSFRNTSWDSRNRIAQQVADHPACPFHKESNCGINTLVL